MENILHKMSLAVHKRRPVKIIASHEAQSLQLNNYEASSSSKSLEKASDINKSATEQLGNIERENR